MPSNKPVGKTIVIRNVTLAYPAVFKPAIDPATNKPSDEYRCNLILSPDEDYSELEEAILEVAMSFFGKTASEVTKQFQQQRGGLNYPILDGEKKWLPEGHRYIIGKKKVQDSNGNPMTITIVDGAKREITDPKKIYGGCLANVVAYVTAYDQMGNKGVTVRLNVIQKIADGERIGGGGSGVDMLDTLESPEQSLMDQLDEVFPAA
jgi:hypothetical protein